MADLDKDLTLKIAANAEEADKAIDGLISRLRTLNSALNIGNLTQFARQLEHIASAANSLSGISKEFNAISSAGSKLASLTGFKTLNDQMKEVHDTSQKLAGDIGKAWSFDAVKDGKKNVQGLADWIEKAMRSAAKSGDTTVIRKEAEMWSELIAQASNSVIDINAETAAFADLASWAKKTTLYLDESTKSWLKYAGTLDLVKSTFKGITSSNLKGSYIEELAEDLQKFGFSGAESNPSDVIVAVAKAIDQYNNAMRMAVVKGRQQIGAGLVSEKDFQEAGRSLASNVEKSFGQIFGEEGTKKDLFGSLLPSLTELSGITIPDFSNLNVLADALTSLQKVNVGKISAVVKAVNTFNDGKSVSVNTSGLETATRVFSQMADTVSEQVTPALDETKKKIDFIVDESGNVQSTLETNRSLFDQIGTSLAVVGENSTALRKNFEEANTEVAVFVDKVEDAVDKMELLTQKGVVTDDDPLGMYKSLASIKEVLEDINNDFVDGTITDEMNEYDAASEKAAESANKAAQSSKNQKSANIDLLASLVALGHELQSVASTFDHWGDSGIKLLKVVFAPLRHEIEEFKKKVRGISDSVKNMRDNMQKHLTKMSAFWKRTMKTFTFMLVRKAITAILNEIKNAVDSLAKWSAQFGTAFNTSMSEITANASYLARSLVAMFEPVINAIVPLLNTLVEALARAARAVAEFFAAFTGASYYMVAKKKVGDYAKELDKANKKQKQLTMGIDELNILNEGDSGSGSGAGGGLADEWDTAPVSDDMKNFVDELKKLFEKIFDPLKKAWDIAKAYVISGFKGMVTSLGELFRDIGNDFLEVWNQPETIAMLVNMFKIIGDLERVVTNLADNFRKAWNEFDRGQRIFENIRDIAAILVQHIRNVTQYMVGWSHQIDFAPLLTGVQNLTDKLKLVAEFVGGVFEDVMKNVVLEYIQFLIEEGIPHLFNTISHIIEAFDFEKLREQLVPIEKVFEGMLENIDTGITNAIGNIGKAVGEFTQTEQFKKFLETVEWFMKQITAERVEKLFTALGDAILNVADKVVRFVSSDKFKEFIQMLLDWYDSKSPEEIATYLERIAGAIAIFKFAGFVGKGLSGFMTFISVVSAAKNIGGILSGIGGGATAASGGMGALASAAAPVAAIIAGIVLAVKSFVDSFGGVSGAIDRLKQSVGDISSYFAKLAENIKLGDSIQRLKESFSGLSESLGHMKDFWEVILKVFEVVIDVVGASLMPIIKGLTIAIGVIVVTVKGVIENLSALGELIVGIFTLDFDKVLQAVEHFVENFIQWFKDLKYQLIGDPIVYDIVDGIIGGFTGMVNTVIKAVKGFVNKIIDFFKKLWSGVVECATKLKDETIAKWEELKASVEEKVRILKDFIVQKWQEIKDKVDEKMRQLKDALIQKWNEVKTQVEDKVRQLRDNLIAKWQEIKEKVEEKVRLLKDEIIKKWKEAKEEVEKKVDELKGELIKKWEAIKSDAEELWNKIKEKIITPIQEAWNKLFGADGLITTLVSKVKAAWEQIITDVNTVLSKVKDAIVKPFKDAWDALFGDDGWITKIVNKVKTAFGDISAEKIGEMLSGVANAITAPFKEAYEAAMGDGGWVSQLLSGIKNFFSSIKTAIDESPLGKFFENITTKINALKEAIKGLKNDAKDAEATTRGSGSETQNSTRITRYATSGYPSNSSLFWTSEYGLYGSGVGSQSSVASSYEMMGVQETIKDTSNQEQNLMSQMVSLLQMIATKDTSVRLDSRELVAMLDDRSRRNGYNFQNSYSLV